MGIVSLIKADGVRPSLSRERAEALLETMGKAHEAVLLHMDGMEMATSDPAKYDEAYKLARWQLSDASLKRRANFNNMLDELLPVFSGEDAAVLRNLLEEDRAQSLASAEHVRKWSPEAVAQDWQGYCAASAAIREKMKKRLMQEALVVLPTLQRVLRSGTRLHDKCSTGQSSA